MLPRASYFQALAAIIDHQVPEWHETVAGLVVLRLVDDWLDFGPSAISEQHVAIATVRALIEQIPDAYLLRGLLRRIVDQVEQTEKISTQTIMPQLLDYASHLQYSGKFLLAEDVLAGLRTKAEKSRDFLTVGRASRQLGITLRTIGRFDEARESYLSAIHYSRKSGDHDTMVLAKLGNAKIIMSYDDISLADTICADIISQTEKTGNTRVLREALHDRAYIATCRDDRLAALSFLYRAQEHTHANTERLSADIATALIVTGSLEKSRRINMILSVTAAEQTVRWGAIVNLMYTAVEQRHKSCFALYRKALSVPSLPPLVAVAYHGHAARGHRIFGDESEALQELQKGYAVADQYRIPRHYVL